MMMAPGMTFSGLPECVVMTYGFNNHAIQTEQWRYIRYASGGEELYDHFKDPDEWTNLAGNAEYAAELKRLSAHLPKTNASKNDKSN